MRFLFSSLHNYCDRTSGAAISTFEVLSELSKRGHSVHTLCGPLFDSKGIDTNSKLQANLILFYQRTLRGYLWKRSEKSIWSPLLRFGSSKFSCSSNLRIYRHIFTGLHLAAFCLRFCGFWLTLHGFGVFSISYIIYFYFVGEHSNCGGLFQLV